MNAKENEESGKNAVFSPILQKNFTTMLSIFARLDGSTIVWEILRNF